MSVRAEKTRSGTLTLSLPQRGRGAGTLTLSLPRRGRGAGTLTPTLPRRGRGIGAFTLIEVLVVISVIMILNDARQADFTDYYTDQYIV